MRIKVFLFAVLTCLLASPGTALGASIDKKKVARAHEEGEAAFFARLKNGAPLLDLGPEDKEALSRAADEYPELFDHLMNIYYFEGDLDKNPEDFRAGFVHLSEAMAEEFLSSITAVPAFPSLSPLKTVLSSAGFFSKKDYPFYKRFFRKMDALPIQDWGIEELKIRDVHRTVQGAGARIAVIDSGLDATIREIRDRTRAYKSFLDGRWPPWDQGDFPYDYNGHGTMIATLAFKTAPSAEYIFVKVADPSTLNETPVTIWTAYLVSAGLIWAVRNGADVISLSLALDQDAPSLRKAALTCWKHNVVLVAAQGNARNGGGESLECYPAAYPTSIAVSGLEKDEAGIKPWRYSARGGFIDVAAPGAGLWTDWPSNLSVLPSSKRAYGNSFAVPFVAGTAALMLSAMDPKLRAELKSIPGRLVETIRGVLRRTASNARLGLETPNDQTGYGMIDIEAAVRAVRGT